jgi:hypothetical protein
MLPHWHEAAIKLTWQDFTVNNTSVARNSDRSERDFRRCLRSQKERLMWRTSPSLCIQVYERLNRLSDFHKILYRNFLYKTLVSKRALCVNRLGESHLPPYFRCCVCWPIWVKSGVQDLQTLPFGNGEFRGNRHSEGRTDGLVVHEITLARVPWNSATLWQCRHAVNVHHGTLWCFCMHFVKQTRGVQVQ